MSLHLFWVLLAIFNYRNSISVHIVDQEAISRIPKLRWSLYIYYFIVLPKLVINLFLLYLINNVQIT
jgi:hypothetical protein